MKPLFCMKAMFVLFLSFFTINSFAVTDHFSLTGTCGEFLKIKKTGSNALKVQIKEAFSFIEYKSFEQKELEFIQVETKKQWLAYSNDDTQIFYLDLTSASAVLGYTDLTGKPVYVCMAQITVNGKIINALVASASGKEDAVAQIKKENL